MPANKLTAARQCLHWAAQIPAAVGNTQLPEEPDFGHLSLEWKPALGALVSGKTPGGAASRAGLRLSDLTLLLLDGSDRIVDELALHGKSLDDGIHWLSTSLRERVGAQLARPLARPEHDLPEHPAAGGGPLRLVPIAAFEELSRWFANAHRVLQPLRVGTPDAAPVRCWPHHFDIATLLTLDPRKPAEKARSIGVGLSPGDASYDEPYWYVTPWPYPSKEDLPALDGCGRWHTDGFVAAILPGSELGARGTADAQLDQVRTFLRSAVDAARALLTR